MSNKLVIFFIFSMIAFGLTEQANAGLPKACGRALVERVLRICHGECTVPFNFDLVTEACDQGISDEAIKVICCP